MANDSLSQGIKGDEQEAIAEKCQGADISIEYEYV